MRMLYRIYETNAMDNGMTLEKKPKSQDDPLCQRVLSIIM
jgi:hypothetical protein